MVKNIFEIKEQMKFIDMMYNKLKKRLNESIKNSENNEYSLENHYSIQMDIVKLRRELMDLSKLLNATYNLR